MCKQWIPGPSFSGRAWVRGYLVPSPFSGITKFTQSEVQSCDLPRLRDLVSISRGPCQQTETIFDTTAAPQGHNSRTVSVSTPHYCSASQWWLEWRMFKFTINWIKGGAVPSLTSHTLNSTAPDVLHHRHAEKGSGAGADLLWFDSVRTNPPVWLYVPYLLSASMIVSDSAADLQTDY